MVSPITLSWSPPHATSVRPAPTVRRRGVRRTNAVVTVLAAAVALWVGLTAPSVSPVTPAAPPAATTDAVTVPMTPQVTAAVPPPAAVTGPRGGRGRGQGR